MLRPAAAVRSFSLPYALALAGTVALAIGLRVALWAFQARSGAVQPSDPEEYYRAALHILQGGYHDSGKWLRPPLYPALLALLFSLFGVDVAAALLGQAVLTGVGVLAFALLGRQLFGSRAVGLLAALMAASFVPLASFGSVLFAEALFVVLVVLGLALLDRAAATHDWRWALAGGAVWGLAALTRAVALFFVPVAALLLLGLRTENREQRTENRELGYLAVLCSLLCCSLLFLLGAAAVIAPWTLRNYLVHDRLILVDTNGGISMWYGTVRGAEDEAAGEAQIFALPNLADRQALALQMTFARFAEDPGFFLSRARYKVASLFLLQSRSYATGEVVTISPAGEQLGLSAGENPLWLSLVADAQYGLIMLGGVVGLAFAPSWRRALPALAWCAVVVGLAALTVAHHRLRLPLVAAMIPFAAYAVLLPLRNTQYAIRNTQYAIRSAAALLLALTFLGLIFSFRYVTWARAERYALAGRQARAAGAVGTAQEAFTQARALDPGNALRTLDLADLAFAQGDLAGAAALFAEAAGQEPRNLYAHAMLMQLGALRDRPGAAGAALAAIQSYGRDNNDLYRWAWSAARTPPPARLVPGDPLALGHYEGFAPATFDLAEGRWTLGQARLRLRGGCGALQLTLHGPAGRAAQLWVEGSDVRREVRLSGTVQIVALPTSGIADCASGAPLVVRVESAVGLLDLERAPWMVGVAVIEAEVTR